jgi:hypothetical protein
MLTTENELLIEELVRKPIWARVRDVEQLYGLSRAQIYALLSDGVIKSAVLKRPGRSRGLRLISISALDDILSKSSSEGE